ncbi:hypothetical protein L3X38_006500 [Prunus dulcis]|uniref:AMP-dependent synthetase/ligase domain-containing protein n=1 Tax=Prunus dulcis TaxID=3755 RepID=A0AAD4ZSX5_PRUDU|nr:hypothetical protein L3X38_006500 [Prunus dulcis]
MEIGKIVSTLGQMMVTKERHGSSNGGLNLKEEINQDDTATLLYSSGTTGASKGVVSSHKNLIAMVRVVLSRFNLDDGEDTFLCTVPMFHIYGLAVFATGLLASGSTIVVLSKFEMHDMLRAIQKHRVAYLPLVPPILVALINAADQIKAKYDLSSLRRVLSGVRIDGNRRAWERRRTTWRRVEGYGTAGCCRRAWRPRLWTRTAGKALAVNQTGELWLKGPTIMKEYFSNAEATAATLDAQGWLRTGDLCYIDEDGFIFVVDRLKELIKYKGYQVPPAELEALLLTHPQIVDGCCWTVSNGICGKESRKQFGRRRMSWKFVGKQVAPYKKIRRVAFIASVPKNPSGKILRKDLIQLATSSSSSKL